MKKMVCKNIIGATAGMLTVVCFIPQTYKVMTTGIVEGLALMTFIILLVEVILWSMYGYMDKNWIIFCTNIPIVAMSIIIIYYICFSVK